MGFGIGLGGVAKGIETGLALNQRDRALDLEGRALDIREKEAGNEVLKQLRVQANETIGLSLKAIDEVIKNGQASGATTEQIAGALEAPLAEVEALATSIGMDMSGIKTGIQARLAMPPPAEGKVRLLEDSNLDEPYANLSPRQIASGIAGGRFVIRTNEQSGASEVMDLATGGLVSRDIPVGAEVDPFANTERPPAATAPDLSRGVGLEGAVKNAVNTLTDALTGEARFEESLEAETALNALSTATISMLQETVPGRPNVFLLEKLEDLVARPNKITQGPARVRSRLSEVRGMIQGEIERIQTEVLNKPTEWKPAELQAAKKSQSQLYLLVKEYTAVLDAFGGNTKERPPIESFGLKGKK